MPPPRLAVPVSYGGGALADGDARAGGVAAGGAYGGGAGGDRRAPCVPPQGARPLRRHVRVGRSLAVCAYSWRGVACAPDGTDRVVELQLPRLRLSGPISPALASLAYLEKLSLRSNLLSGTILSSLSCVSSLRVVFLLRPQWQRHCCHGEGVRVRHRRGAAQAYLVLQERHEDGDHPRPAAGRELRGPGKHALHELRRVVLADSVLKRDSERLKDLYTLGKKLGQGQFGSPRAGQRPAAAGAA